MKEQQTLVNKQFSLSLRDGARGLLMAVASAVVATLYAAMSQGGFKAIDWNVTLEVAVIAGLVYLGKNYFTPSEIVLQNPPKEEIKKVDAGEATVNVDTTVNPNNTQPKI